MSADDFGDGACFEMGVARVFPFRRIDEEDVFAGLQSVFFYARQQFFFGGAGLGG